MAITPTEPSPCCADCAIVIANDDDSGLETERAMQVRDCIADVTRQEGGYLVVTDSGDPYLGNCYVCLAPALIEYEVRALIEN